MENKKNIQEDPVENAPFLSKIEIVNQFSTPKNYFKELPEVINSKLLKTSSLLFYFDKLSYRIFAPILVTTTVLLLLFYLNTNTPSFEMTPAQISEVLINGDYIDLDEDLINETYFEIIEAENQESGSEEYINYLIENDIDITTIITEL